MAAPAAPTTRRMRFVCISDTHNGSPHDGCFKLPPGDVLIHAGDLTNQGTFHEIKKTMDWIAASDYGVKIVIAGNHDITLDANFYELFGGDFHDRYPQDSRACIEYMSKHHGIIYLNQDVVDVKLVRTDGALTRFRVYGSPYSPKSGHWAFSYEPVGSSEDDEGVWRDIPEDTDILVTHTPPRDHCDNGEERSCPGLWNALSRVRPKLAVCGHIHEGWGAETVTWYLDEDGVRSTHAVVKRVQLDRVSKKLAKIDLTSKSRIMASVLDNSQPDARLQSTEDVPKDDTGEEDPKVEEGRSAAARRAEKDVEAGRRSPLTAEDPPVQLTCIVNAALKAKSRHAGRSSGPQYNKPIIVDLDLPTDPLE